MEGFGYFLIGLVILFILASFIFFIKRLNENKDKLKSLSSENSSELQRQLEDEVKKKREKEIKKLETGDKLVIKEVVERLFKSSKMVGWIKSKNFILYDQKRISFVINLTGKEDLVSVKKEVVLKSGEVYTQNKHYLAVKKEYAEKVFQCAYKILEEMYSNIPTIYKVFLSIYITKEENEEQMCVLSMEATKDQYNAVKNQNNTIIQKIDFFNAKYDYDLKNYDFKEVEPIETPIGEVSLEKTMATKATTSTSFYGSTITDSKLGNVNLVSQNDNNIKVNSTTKISDLNNASFFLDKSILGDIVKINETNNKKSITDILLEKLEFKLLSENSISEDLTEIIAINNSNKKVIIGFSKNESIVKDESLKDFLFKAIKKDIDNFIYISNSTFALDAVKYAIVNEIELFDKDKLNKILELN